MKLRNDSALLRLDGPVEQRPIAIAGERRSPGPVRAMGWGMSCEGGADCPQPPHTLQQLGTRIVPDGRRPDIGAERDFCSQHPPSRSRSAHSIPAVRSSRAAPGWTLVGVSSRDGDFVTDPSSSPAQRLVVYPLTCDVDRAGVVLGLAYIEPAEHRDPDRAPVARRLSLRPELPAVDPRRVARTFGTRNPSPLIATPRRAADGCMRSRGATGWTATASTAWTT